MPEIPIDQREHEQLEFKSRDALNDLYSVGREVVALLNANGGEIWIGIAERDGVAHSIEPVDSARWDQVWNHLVDTIEPSPTERDVSHQMVPVSGSQSARVMQITVRPSAVRGPFAQLKHQGRHFWLRVGPRVRSMSREEVRAAFAEAQSPPLAVSDELEVALRTAAEQRQGDDRAGLWLRIEVRPGCDLPVGTAPFREYLMQAALSGNRESGWNGMNPYAEPQRRQGVIVQGEPGEGPALEVHREGAIVFQCPRESLFWKGPATMIWPFALLEYVVSSLRLARTLYDSRITPATSVGAHVAIFGARGLTLRPLSPTSNRFLMAREAKVFDSDDDFILARPCVSSWPDFRERLGAFATRLIGPIYEDFGFGLDAIPRELNRETGELTFST